MTVERTPKVKPTATTTPIAKRRNSTRQSAKGKRRPATKDDTPDDDIEFYDEQAHGPTEEIDPAPTPPTEPTPTATTTVEATLPTTPIASIPATIYAANPDPTTTPPQNGEDTTAPTEEADVEVVIATDEQLHSLTANPDAGQVAVVTTNEENPFLVNTTVEATSLGHNEPNNFPVLDDNMPDDAPLAGANDNIIDNILLDLDNEIAENAATLNLDDIQIPAGQDQDEIHITTQTTGFTNVPFTPTPVGGFPDAQDGKPRRILENVQGRQGREWLETKGYNAFIQVAGTNACNYETPNTVAKLKAALIGAVGIRDPLIATPTDPTDPQSYKPRTFFLREIPEFLHRRLLHQRVWSTPEIAFFAYPTTFKFPRFIGTYRGFTTGDP
ncbi:hypothetical protein QCA50_009759 [Cerrena zonata]|uniref:Uncharacterized protein n=1 Tax=Cerrena zonata TaxID=2478898 RepID=A0AAW0G6D0_9APHY